MTPDLRMVSARLRDLQLTIRFIYERPPTSLEVDLVESAVTEVIADVWQELAVATQIDVMDPDTDPSPLTVDHQGGERVMFRRYEVANAE